MTDLNTIDIVNHTTEWSRLQCVYGGMELGTYQFCPVYYLFSVIHLFPYNYIQDFQFAVRMPYVQKTWINLYVLFLLTNLLNSPRPYIMWIVNVTLLNAHNINTAKCWC